MKFTRTLCLLGGLWLAAGAAFAANVPLISGPWDPSQTQSTINSTIQNVNANAQGYQPLNYLDNGDFLITQGGTGIVTGGGTSGPAITAQVADRWMVECNVGSCQPRGQVVTSASGVTFAPGFANAVSLYRNSAALTQPIQLEQEIKSARFTLLQGKPVIMSCWLAANVGAPGVTATFHLFTGTDTDAGLGSLRSAVGMTASPALTPVWTGITTAGTYTTPALTATSTRYISPAFVVPVAATEGAFEVDWTPAAETAGTTDGIIVQGCQLEEAEPNQATAGRFYRKAYEDELRTAQRYFMQWNDNLASTFQLPGTCTETTSGTTATCILTLPTPQDLAAPVAAVATATSFGMTKVADGTAEACSTLAVVASSSTPQTIGLTCAASETAAVGTMHILIYANTGAANTLKVNSAF